MIVLHVRVEQIDGKWRWCVPLESGIGGYGFTTSTEARVSARAWARKHNVTIVWEK